MSKTGIYTQMITTAREIVTYVRLTLRADCDAAAAGRISSKPAMRIGVSRLTTPVTTKLKHRAMKPGFKP